MIQTIPFILKALKAYQDVQHAIPHTHIGGSIGLFLHGIVLPRDWYNGPLDLDVTLREDLPENAVYDFMVKDESGLSSGMDMNYKFAHVSTGIKVELQIDPDSQYVPVMYKGFIYRVKTIEGIMYWKRKWAVEFEDSDEDKHRRDLAYLEKGYILTSNICKPIDF